MIGEGCYFHGCLGAGTTDGLIEAAIGHTPEDPWNYSDDSFTLAAGGLYLDTSCALTKRDLRNSHLLVLATGSLYLGSDSDFGESTSVAPIPIESASELIAQAFERNGPQVFSLLDGDFSLVIYDSRSKTVHLVVDKLGCNDIYWREGGGAILFSSRPSDLFHNSEPFDALSVAFFLAHEGFVPAPYTLSESVKSIGRSRYAKLSARGGKVRCEIKSYWSPQARWSLSSTAESRRKLHRVLRDSIAVHGAAENAVLLSGGIDSSLILNLAALQPGKVSLALTGSVKGWEQGEEEIAHSSCMAKLLGIPHDAVLVDPYDDSLPDESFQCTSSWMSGARLILPLWQRFGVHLRRQFGVGYHVLAGQTADTLADNNYTSLTPGYRLRRILFSSWFLRALPVLGPICPSNRSSLGKHAIGYSRFIAGDKVAEILASILTGMSAPHLFYLGRVFGYSEMPGVSQAYFPMLTMPGFDQVVAWYAAQFVQPLIEGIDSANFYQRMIQLSMDMNMLHLDSRLLLHIYREEGGHAQLPFMDARLVTLFGSLPYSARAWYREPKHIIRCQLRRKGMKHLPRVRHEVSSRPVKSQDQLLLEGTIGAFYRDLLRQPTFPDRSRTLFAFLDEQYLEKQIRAFHQCDPAVDYRFIARLGSLEVWSQALMRRPHQSELLGLQPSLVDAS